MGDVNVVPERSSGRVNVVPERSSGRVNVVPERSSGGVAIGIDAGGSVTRGVLVDGFGVELARVGAGGANVRSMSATVVAQVFAAVLGPLLVDGGVRAVCIGAAGAGREADRLAVAALAEGLIPPGVKLVVKHDAEVALRAAAATRPAMVVMAGTGSIAYGERADGSSVRAGGYGALIGDEGSGYAIGLAAIRHTARALDGVDRRGPLANAVATALKATSSGDVIERVHRWPPDLTAIAALAALVGEACDVGDPAAEDIAIVQARSLASMAARVARAVRRDASDLPVALAGGAFDAIPLLYDAVGRATQRTGRCTVSRLLTAPAMGAALIALDQLNTDA